MKKLYSKRLGKEAYALTPEQLSVFARSGYQTPKPEEVSDKKRPSKENTHRGRKHGEAEPGAPGNHQKAAE